MSKTGTTPSTPPRPHGYGYIDPSAPLPLRAVMAVYRFLASVKLAVISILSLAGTLAYATWFEKRYGSMAVQQYVYEGVWFSILLAFLAINIFCAASIRFPWKRRQTGFVVTHVGLLTLIFGSWWGFQYSDEGQAGGPEGGVIDKLVRTKYPVVRVKELAGHDVEFELPFNGGPFDWPEGRYEVISKPKDPFRVAVRGYHPSARPSHVEHVAAESGAPMLRLRPRAKPPRAAEFMDAFPDPNQRWFSFAQSTQGYRITHKAGAALFAFLYVDRPELVADFLDPPKDYGRLGVARLHYVDKAGKDRRYDLRIDDAHPDVPIALPDSDLTATFLDEENVGEGLDLLRFSVRRGEGREVMHLGVAGRPMAPSTLPSRGGAAEPPLLRVDYDKPPLLGGGMSKTFGLVEVLGDPQGRLYYRVFGRDETPVSAEEAAKPRPGLLRKGPAPLKLGETVVAFGGNPNQPMTLDFTAEAYITSGEEKVIYEKQPMPEGKQSDGVAAALVELTVDGEAKDVWVQRPSGLELPPYTRVNFRGKAYDVAFDSEREPLGFSMLLKDFEVKHDPGTAQAASYTSEVLLTDEKAGIKEQPVTITMNHPLTHRKLTFYQSSFHPTDSGDFASIFQVGHDAGRPLKYLGSALIVLGAFLQFYMRAGVFSGAAKADDPEAAGRARTLLKKKGEKAPPVAVASKKGKAKKSKNYDDAIL